MSERVVNVLEIIQIEEQDRHDASFAVCLSDCLVDPVVQQQSIRQICQGVVLGQMRNLLRKRPRNGHVAKYQNRSCCQPGTITDGSDGVLDKNLMAFPTG